MNKDTRVELTEERVREIVREELKEIAIEQERELEAIKPKGMIFHS